jgi:hypothetical protein
MQEQSVRSWQKCRQNTCKDVFTKIDARGWFTYTASSEMKDSVKDIWMTVVHPHPALRVNNKLTTHKGLWLPKFENRI